MATEEQIRTQVAISTLVQTRAELRALFQPDQQGQPIPPDTFPRSKTVRWAISHPLSRIFGSTLSGALTRMLLARFIGTWVLGRKS